MGIPKLTQDLAPYAEHKQVGCGSGHRQIIAERWILDGPSVVYHVYGDLLANRATISASAFVNVPTYQEIGAAVCAYLSTLESHGIHVKAIFFDGDLPISKRHIRLERLEKRRGQLERFRMGNTNRLVYLPPLPFIVAASIESLYASEWARRVHVVPEEADAACARVAAKETVSVLTNDSDLALFPIRPESRIVWLHSLLKSIQNDGSTKLQASCLVPSTVAAHLNLPDLLPLGFARQLDPSATTAEVLERARRGLRDGSSIVEYARFSEQYFLARADGVPFNLNGLDPRVAEYVLQLSTLVEKPFVYLPILHEDPSRDASWYYGIELRQLAYSITRHFLPVTTLEVAEFFRKGRRVTPSSVQTMSDQEINAAVDTLVKTITLQSVDTTASIVAWWCLALSIVSSSKTAYGKRVDMTIARALFGLEGKWSQVISWDSVHLHANMQAVLYSLRMIKQILTYLKREQLLAKALRPKILQLLEILDHMPPMEALFLEIRQLRSSLAPSDRDLVITILGSDAEILAIANDQKGLSTPGVKIGRLKTRNGSWESRNGFSILASESESDDESTDNLNESF